MSEELQLKEHCYVLPYLNNGPIHPITYRRHELIWYPERAMSLFDQIQYRPYVDSVVTESPWIIACYPSERVRIWEDKRWSWPDRQTYGASVNHIMMTILGVRQTIPSRPLDGGDAMRELITKLEQERA